MYQNDYYEEYQHNFRKVRTRSISLSQKKENYRFERNTAYAVKYFSNGLEFVINSGITYGAGVTTGPIGAYLALELSQAIIGVGFDLIDYGFDEQISKLDDLISQIEDYEAYQSNVPTDTTIVEKILKPKAKKKRRSQNRRRYADRGRWQSVIDRSPKYDNVGYERGQYGNIA